MMNELLRTSRIENFWLRWNLQEMGPRISQLEYNATVMPMNMGKRRLSRVTAAACPPSPYAFTPSQEMQSQQRRQPRPRARTVRLQSTSACLA